MYTNRFVCSVLDEMRKSIGALDPDNTSAETFRRYRSHARTLVEEAQTMVNRMEEALTDVGDIKRMKKERKELHAEVRGLRGKKKKLEKETRDSATEDKESLARYQEILDDSAFLREFSERGDE